MKHIAIGKIFTSFYASSEEIEDDACGEKIDSFYSEFRDLCDKHDIKFADSYTTFYGMEKYSIHTCDNCNRLMINRDKNPMGFGDELHNPEIGMVVWDGGEHEGNLLCEECLPCTHRWGHNS